MTRARRLRSGALDENEHVMGTSFTHLLHIFGMRFGFGRRVSGTSTIGRAPTELTGDDDPGDALNCPRDALIVV